MSAEKLVVKAKVLTHLRVPYALNTLDLLSHCRNIMSHLIHYAVYRGSVKVQRYQNLLYKEYWFSPLVLYFPFAKADVYSFLSCTSTTLLQIDVFDLTLHQQSVVLSSHQYVFSGSLIGDLFIHFVDLESAENISPFTTANTRNNREVLINRLLR